MSAIGAGVDVISTTARVDTVGSLGEEVSHLALGAGGRRTLCAKGVAFGSCD